MLMIFRALHKRTEKFTVMSMLAKLYKNEVTALGALEFISLNKPGEWTTRFNNVTKKGTPKINVCFSGERKATIKNLFSDGFEETSGSHHKFMSHIFKYVSYQTHAQPCCNV